MTYLIKIICLLLLLGTSAIVLSAQSSTSTKQENPFEIGYSIDTNRSELQPITNSDSTTGLSAPVSSNNPFEVSKVRVTPDGESPKGNLGIFKSLSKSVSQGSMRSRIPLVVIVLSILLITVGHNLNRKLLARIYSALINENQLRILKREDSNRKMIFYLFYLLFIINIALASAFIAELMFQISVWDSFLWLLLAIAITYIVRHSLNSSMSAIFSFGDILESYGFTIAHFNIALSLILFVFNLLLAFSGIGIFLIYALLFILAVFLLFRYVKGLIIGLGFNGLSPFHFFLYICAFEVLPNYMLIQLITGQYSGL